MDEGVAALVVTSEERWRGLAAQVAVDALLVDVELAGGIAGPFFRFVLTGSFFTCQHRGETQFNTITVGVGAVQLADVFIVFHHLPAFVIST